MPFGSATQKLWSTFSRALQEKTHHTTKKAQGTKTFEIFCLKPALKSEDALKKIQSLAGLKKIH